MTPDSGLGRSVGSTLRPLYRVDAPVAGFNLAYRDRRKTVVVVACPVGVGVLRTG